MVIWEALINDNYIFNKYHNFNLGSFAILSIHEIELNDKLLEKII